MGMRAGVVVALAAITASVYAWGWYDDGVSHRQHRQSLLSASDTGSQTAEEELATSAVTDRARVFSAKHPLLTTLQLPDVEPDTAAEASAPVGRWSTKAKVAVHQETADPTPTPAAVAAPSRRLSSLRPGDEDARAELVRDIQYELKRAGCYEGEVHGIWNANTKRAMKSFTDRVNAALPVDQPDYALLALAQNERPGVCNGPSVVAQPRGARKGAVAVASDQAGPDTRLHQPASAPLPGRMAVGAPVGGSSERQEITLDEARRIAASGRLDMQTQSAALAPDPTLQPTEAAAEAARAAARRNAERKRTVRRGPPRQVFLKLMNQAP